MSASAQLSAARERLEAVDAAIKAAYTGSAVSMAGASITRQTLEELRGERVRLLRQIRDLETVLAGGRATAAAVARFPVPGS